MSYNGTVTCSHCYRTGHNRRSCPQRKADRLAAHGATSALRRRAIEYMQAKGLGIGTIVMGENVRISSVAIAQGSLTIRVTEAQQASQPGPFAEVGTTKTLERTDVQVDESGDRRLAVLNPGVTLQELVNGLNALGIGPRDMITILQAIKASGALQAEIEVM